MIRKGRLEPLKQFWDREGDVLGGINTGVPSWTGETFSTLLHVAAASGQANIVLWMLEDQQANPTLSMESVSSTSVKGRGENDVKVMSDHRAKQVPYDVASTREVRNVFRRCAGEHPDRWDWLGGAHVPSALDMDMELEREEKRKERRKALKNKMKDKSAKGASKVEVESPKVAHTQSTSLSAEAQASLEREKRAQAAESRIRAMRQSKGQ
jgi:hypothetical protein